MNKDSFIKLAASKSPFISNENIAKKAISNIHEYLSNIAEDAYKENPNTRNSLSVASTGNGFSTMLTLKEDYLSYSFNPEQNRINIVFNGTIQYFLTFSNNKVISSRTNKNFDFSSIDSDLDLFNN
ncbi:hypothetical protein [Lactiplantibacillus plantarum]|uniref:hypothetical protein n=1 Tax=Lactiplantibacillus plantarum TaxID=1590 RepID=UPI0007094DF2|nr:hypothetical protein [Lactiplantibacillus plantarum]